MEWFSDYPKHYYLKPDDSGAEEARFIRKVLHLRRGDSVLDAPCGAGRIAACLAKGGIRVTGIDLTPSYIRRARRRFRREGLSGRFVAADLRKIDFQEQFDGVFNWQGSFGFFPEKDNLDVLRRYARSLRSGGRVLIDQPGREWLLRHFRGSGGYGSVKFSARWHPNLQRVKTCFRDTETGDSWSMTIRFYTPSQFRKLLRQAGMELEGFYRNLDAEPYRRGARRIYVVGRKP